MAEINSQRITKFFIEEYKATYTIIVLLSEEKQILQNGCFFHTLSIISLEGTSVVSGINKHIITVIIKRKTPDKIKNPNFNLHIKKPDALASKTFTAMVRVLDNTIPSILVSGGNVSLSHPDGPLINVKHML
jgi:hypothetical protein